MLVSAPKMTAGQVRYWVTRFRKLDVRIKEHRKMLIDGFLNRCYKMDDASLRQSGQGAGKKQRQPVGRESVHVPGRDKPLIAYKEI